MGGVVKQELSRVVTGWSVIGLLIFILLGGFILQIGIEKSKIEKRQKVEFIDNEMQKIKRYVNVKMYGAYGVRRLLKASPLFSLFFNSSPISELQAFIDVGVRLELSKPEIGAGLFDESIGGILDYSWYLLVLGSMIVVPMGFFTFRNREYLRFLMNFTSAKNVYMGVTLARVLLILISLGLTVCLAYIQFLVNGIKLTTGEIFNLLIFLLLIVIAMVFLQVVSAGLGASKKWIKWGVITFALWFIVVFLWPEIINLVFSAKATTHMKSFYSHENTKIEKLMKFERDGYEKIKTGRYETVEEKKESDRKEAEKWWREDFKKIEEIENEMINKAKDIAGDFQFWCLFTPTTFYRSVNNELGSKGFNSYVKFYKGNLVQQRGFLRFYLDKRYYENYSKFESYLSKNEIVVTAKTSLPRFFVLGLIINGLFIILAVFFSHFRFKSFLFPRPERPSAFNNFKMDLKTGNYNTINIFAKDFTNQFLNVLYGWCKRFRGKISIDGKNIVSSLKKNFFYLPDPDKIPGWIKIGTFLNILGGFLRLPKEKIKELKEEYSEWIDKRFSELSKLEKAGLLFRAARLSNAKIYVFHDFFKEIYDSHMLQLVRQIEELKSEGILIVDMITGSGLNAPSPDCNTSIAYEDSEYKVQIFKENVKRNVGTVRRNVETSR